MLRLVSHQVCIRLLLAFAAGVLVSCSSSTPSTVWNENGRTVEDLSPQSRKKQHAFPLAPGATLYADSITFSDARKLHGHAVGNVLLVVAPLARSAWLFDRGYAGMAEFDLIHRSVVLKGRPMLERHLMTQVATEDATSFVIHWNGMHTDVVVAGPTRSDFTKSHPIPPNSPSFSQLSPRSPPLAPGGAS